MNTDCPLRRALKVLGGKWNLIIIKEIGSSELRFNEINKKIPDITEKMLIEKLKVLSAYELVTRKDFMEIPPKVTYHLTSKGKKALNIVEKIEDFGATL